LIPLPHQASFYNQNGFIIAPHERQNSDNSQNSAGAHSASHNSVSQNIISSQNSISINSQNSGSHNFSQNLTSPTSSNASSPSLKQKNLIHNQNNNQIQNQNQNHALNQNQNHNQIQNKPLFSNNSSNFEGNLRNMKGNTSVKNNNGTGGGLLNQPSEITTSVATSIWSPSSTTASPSTSRARDIGASSGVYGFDQHNNAQASLTNTNNNHNFSGWNQTSTGYPNLQKFDDFPELK
jgi:hypothetical protein